jgi:branched-chain amino acid transport system permease protein
MKKRLFAALLLLLILILFPLIVKEQYFLNLAVMVLYYTFLSQAWNILSGFSGQFSFGHAAFFGTGAYTSTVLLGKYDISPWLGLLIGAIVALLIALFIGYLSFRYKLRGAYFALGTLAFAEILRIIVQNSSYFNKTMGIIIDLKEDPSMFQFASREMYYYVILVFAVLCTLLVYFISRSRLGYNLIAIRENEEAAQSLGVNTFKNKMIAIGLSAALTAIGGTFYAQYMLYIDPHTTFGTDTSISILLPAIIGGAGTVLGPFVGSLLMIPLGELTKTFFGGFSGVHLMVYGLILVIVMLFLPQGIIGWVQDLAKRKRNTSGKEGGL